MLCFYYMMWLSCQDRELDCEFRVEGEAPSEVVSKYIAHCLEFHPEYLGSLRQTMTEDEIRKLLMEQARTA